MPTWTLAIPLDRDSEEPLYLQIVRAITEGIQQGRFRPGEGLPGTRGLAEQLGVNRNTTMAAYQELESEGWIVSHPDRGTFIADHPPVQLGRVDGQQAADSGSWNSPTPLTEPFFQPGSPRLDDFSLIPDEGDLRMAPSAAIQRAHGRVLNLQKHRMLQPGWDPRGLLSLRMSLVRMLADLRGLALEAGNIVLTRGLMSTLTLVSRSLYGPGDAVVVENPGSFRVTEAFRAAGARLLSVPVDDRGIDVEALEALVLQEPVRLVHVTAAPQVPTRAVLPPDRRRHLLELARSHGFLILEGDPGLGFQRERNPSLPLAVEDHEGRVVYYSGLDQMLAPGLQVGFLAGAGPLIKGMAKQRQLIDWPGNQMQEATLEELFRDEEMARHLARIRKVTAERRETMVDRLLLHLGRWVTVEDPREGLALWVKVDPAIPVDAWVDRCAARGVMFYPGRLFDIERRPMPAICLGFAGLDAGEQNQACERMLAALREVPGFAKT